MRSTRRATRRDRWSGGRRRLVAVVLSGDQADGSQRDDQRADHHGGGGSAAQRGEHGPQLRDHVAAELDLGVVVVGGRALGDQRQPAAAPRVIAGRPATG